MKFSAKYSKNKQFGTQESSKRFVASVTRESGLVEVAFEYAEPQQGITSTSKVEWLRLRLSEDEAMQLATALIANLQHPTFAKDPVYWIPTNSTNPLELPEKQVTVNEISECRLTIENNSNVHIGEITFRVSFSWRNQLNELVNREKDLRKLVDLPPRATTTIEIQQRELRHGYEDWDGSEFRRILEKAIPISVTEM